MHLSIAEKTFINISIPVSHFSLTLKLPSHKGAFVDISGGSSEYTLTILAIPANATNQVSTLVPGLCLGKQDFLIT